MSSLVSECQISKFKYSITICQGKYLNSLLNLIFSRWAVFIILASLQFHSSLTSASSNNVCEHQDLIFILFLLLYNSPTLSNEILFLISRYLFQPGKMGDFQLDPGLSILHILFINFHFPVSLQSNCVSQRILCVYSWSKGDQDEGSNFFRLGSLGRGANLRYRPFEVNLRVVRAIIRFLINFSRRGFILVAEMNDFGGLVWAGRDPLAKGSGSHSRSCPFQIDR